MTNRPAVRSGAKVTCFGLDVEAWESPCVRQKGAIEEANEANPNKVGFILHYTGQHSQSAQAGRILCITLCTYSEYSIQFLLDCSLVSVLISN